MYVYTITHIDTCRTYVGKSHNPARRFAEHKCPGNLSKYPTSHLYAAMAKYGWRAFDFAVVQECASDKEAYIAEQDWISDLQSNVKQFGFNLNGGGEGGQRPTAEVRARISAAGKGVKKSPEARANMVAAIKRRAPATAETRALIGAASRARLTPEHQSKMVEAARLANTGKPISEETKLKLSKPRPHYKRSPEGEARRLAASTASRANKRAPKE
jgi:group I intron endonuclease